MTVVCCPRVGRLPLTGRKPENSLPNMPQSVDFSTLTHGCSARRQLVKRSRISLCLRQPSIPRRKKIHIGKRDSARLFITVDPDADIFYTSDRLRGDNIVTIIGTNATDDYLTMLEGKGISYIVLENPTALDEALSVLYDKFGVRKISLQGGGIINGAMLAAGLISELSLVIYPGIDGLTTAPSIFEYLGASDECPASGQSLELISSRTYDNGIVWLRYRFHRDGL